MVRNIKDKKYPLWRLDVLFSDKKYFNVKFIEEEDGIFQT